jgi:amino-acid N-acetyltransferase
MLAQSDFVAWFRSAAPYIRGFSGQTFVIAVGGEVVEDGNFVELTHDLNLLASVGVRIVLVHGARPQIEQALKSQKNCKTHLVNKYQNPQDLVDQLNNHNSSKQITLTIY